MSNLALENLKKNFDGKRLKLLMDAGDFDKKEFIELLGLTYNHLSRHYAKEVYDNALIEKICKLGKITRDEWYSIGTFAGENVSLNVSPNVSLLRENVNPNVNLNVNLTENLTENRDLNRDLSRDLLPENPSNGSLLSGRGVVVRHLSNMRAVAGDVISIDSAFEEVEEWIVPRLGIVGGSGLAMYSFEVQGDSMLPTIAPRDLLLCEAPITTLQNIQNNAIYVIVNADGVRCKRLRYLKQSHSVCIFSDNKAYRDEELKEGTFSALRVVQRITNVSQFF
jgi:phage repressor protein C with HTH and peptisase S24 domain